jgi:hypothetical protein
VPSMHARRFRRTVSRKNGLAKTRGSTLVTVPPSLV